MLRWIGLGILVATAACSALRTGSLEDTGGAPNNNGSSGTSGSPSNDDNPNQGTSSGTSGFTKDGGGGLDEDGGVITSDGGTGNVKVASITVGENVACVVFVNGEMRCWGDYRLAGGGSTSTPKPSPVPIRPADGAGFLVGVAEVSASYRHACARLFSGGFSCWGFNNEYQLGDFTRDITATTTTAPFARTVKDSSVNGPALKGPANLPAVGKVSAGVGYSAAVIDGVVYTWGYTSGSDNLVLGRGDPSQADAITPKPVFAVMSGATPPTDDRLLNVTHVDVGRGHACARLGSNQVACWGDNASGKLGIGSGVSITDGRPRLVSVPDSAGLLKVAVGDTSACALTAAGRVRCWGQNNLGQSGKSPVGGSQQDASLDVKMIGDVALDQVVDIGVGDGFACALRSATSGGKVYCWGTGAGSVLGDGTTVERSQASAVASALVPTKKDLEGARLLAVGDSSACVVIGDRDVRCWGQGPLGERGESSSTSSIPRVVDDL